MHADKPLSIVVLISGNGSNLQAIIDDIASYSGNANITAVISNRPDVYGLVRAKAADIPTRVIDHTGFENRLSFDQALQDCIDEYQPGLIILAGFMRILSPGFVSHYHGRMINIHPSLLPEFTGVNTHQRVLDAGKTEHGVSIHFVTEELDGGPVICQSRIPVKTDDTSKSLAMRLQIEEHRLYPIVVQWIASQRLYQTGNQVVFDEHVLETPVDLTESPPN